MNVNDLVQATGDDGVTITGIVIGFHWNDTIIVYSIDHNGYNVGGLYHASGIQPINEAPMQEV